MSIHIAAAVLHQCAAVARILVSPLTYSSVGEWRHAINMALVAAFQADQAFSIMPGGGPLLQAHDIDDDGVRTITSYLQGFDDSGRLTLRDPVVNDWNDRRRALGLTVYTRDLINTAIKGRVLESPFVQDALFPNRMKFWQGIYAPTPDGTDTLLWVSYSRRSGEPFGEQSVALLGLLQPALHAGVAAVARLDTARRALDAFSEPFIIVDRFGRELHRGPRLTELLQHDLQAEVVVERARGLAREVAATLAKQPAVGNGVAPAVVTVRTRFREYSLTATVAPADVFTLGEAILILVSTRGAPALPAPERLIERFGLTRREADVALQLASGATRDAIAAALGVSPHTVRAHTEHVFLKLGVKTRSAVAMALLNI
ncbi:MAG TPA: helix-turn-helix transcriptional regulator [Gemmatimonadaceae bacterium]